MGSRAAVFLVGLAALGSGCRDAPGLFDTPDLDPLGPTPYRLTFNPADDRAPTWNGGSDSVLYLAENPALRIDVLQTIHREGGAAFVVFPEIQGSTITVPLESAAPDPLGRRIAMLSLLSANPADLCGPTSSGCIPALNLSPPSRLDSALVRVRARGETGPPEADPNLVVRYPGRFFDSSLPVSGLPGTWVIDLYPFQDQFNRTGKPPTEPSWSPDGQRLVLSDGLRLFLWDPATSSDPQGIPGTADGIRPSWSPTGEWIAYQHLRRGAQSSAFCEHRNQFGTLGCVEQRVQWTVVARQIVIVRPDGSGPRVLASGTGPTWSPDGQRVLYVAADGIRSVALDGTDDIAIPGTEGGSEPAVSADGRWLAFSRSDEVGRDVWIVELVP